MVFLTLFVPLAITACSAASPSDEAQSTSGTDDGVNQPGLTLAMCGTVTAWTAPDASHDGSLGIDGRTWVVLSTATLASTELLVENNPVCIDATFDASDHMDSCTVMLHFP